MENLLKPEDFDLKYSEISAKIEENEARLNVLWEAKKRRSLINERIIDFRRLLQKNEILSKSDRTIFEGIVENVIIGGVNREMGEQEFVCNSASDDFETLYCDSFHDARGNAGSTTTKIGRKYTEIRICLLFRRCT